MDAVLTQVNALAKNTDTSTRQSIIHTLQGFTYSLKEREDILLPRHTVPLAGREVQEDPREHQGRDGHRS